MTNETLLKNITFEDIKRYLENEGYAVVKKPVIKTRLKPCPICGRLPVRIVDDTSIRYECIDDGNHDFIGVSSSFVSYATMFNDCCHGPIIAEYRSKEKADEMARQKWNKVVNEFIKEEK